MFAFDYSRLNRVLLGLLGSGPSLSRVRVDVGAVNVQMGPSFRAIVPRERIRSAEREAKLPFLGWAFTAGVARGS